MSQNIPDPFGPIAEYAIALHLLYEALRDAGFSEEQAMAFMMTAWQFALAASVAQANQGGGQ